MTEYQKPDYSFFRPILQFCRTHTSPLEIIPAIAGAALATGGIGNIEVLIWGVYGFLYHQAGYSMNSYIDWYKGYDRDDPHKQHHPLNTNHMRFGPFKAAIIWKGLFFITIIYALVAAWPSLIAYGILVSGGIAGVAYNKYGKEMKSKAIPISYAHSTVFAVPYIASGGDNILILLWGWFYVFSWVIYQIQIEGDIKDMETDEVNFLKDNGAKYFNGKVEFPSTLRIYSHLIKLMSALVIFGVCIYLSNNRDLALIAAFIVFGSSVVYGNSLLADGEYNRMKRIGYMAKIEILMIIALLVAISPVITLTWAYFLMMGSVLWVISFNRYQWGTWLAPAV